MYNEKVLEMFYEPENVGVIKGASGVGKIVDDTCGEILKIYISVENKKIVDAKFQAFGSPALISATAAATKLILGKTLDEAKAVNADQVLAELGGELPDNKKYVCPLAEKAIKKAVDSVGKKGNKDEE